MESIDTSPSPSQVSEFTDAQILEARKRRGRKKRRETGPAWVKRCFNSKQAKNEGIVRRSISVVERCASIEEFSLEVRERGFHLVSSGGQLIAFCNKGDLTLIC